VGVEWVVRAEKVGTVAGAGVAAGVEAKATEEVVAVEAAMAAVAKVEGARVQVISAGEAAGVMVMVEGVTVAAVMVAAVVALAEEARTAMSCQQTECLIQPPQRPPRSSRQTLRRCTRYLKKRRTARCPAPERL